MSLGNSRYIHQSYTTVENLESSHEMGAFVLYCKIQSIALLIFPWPVSWPQVYWFDCRNYFPRLVCVILLYLSMAFGVSY